MTATYGAGQVRPGTGERRALPVPDGLDGERLDAAAGPSVRALPHLGAELASAGNVLVDGATAAKSERMRGGGVAGGELPAPPARAARR